MIFRDYIKNINFYIPFSILIHAPLAQLGYNCKVAKESISLLNQNLKVPVPPREEEMRGSGVQILRGASGKFFKVPICQ